MKGALFPEITLKNYGLATIAEFVQDRIVFRNLSPIDPEIPGLDCVGPREGVPVGRIPRKIEPDYARVVTRFLRRARELQALQENSPVRPIRRLVFIGDTRMLDGSAFSNLCAAGGWHGLAFIGSENTKPAEFQVVPGEGGERLILANRWAALPDFDRFCAEQGLPVDADTAVVVDMDKTALGARGRNATVIDTARVEAVKQTVAGVLGETFDAAAFRWAYDPLNQPEFHPFTGDNQDYLAYICLILGAGAADLNDLMAHVRSGRLTSFDEFIASIENRKQELPAHLIGIHDEIYARVLAGDPTPFKAFRRREYLTTQSRFGCLPDDTPIERLLQEEILITQEVRQMALEWTARGALLFGLSDKPDEAAVPTPEQTAQGFRPLHRTPTHAVGV